MKINPCFISLESHQDRFTILCVTYTACVVGFRAACRPLVFLDRTFLKDHHNETLLAATAYDRDNGLFPLAFYVCGTKNEKNWAWFAVLLCRLL